MEKQGNHLDSSGNARHVPSTSTGQKRNESSSTSQTVDNNNNNNKRLKSDTSDDGPNKFQCKVPGCGKTFRDNHDLSRHERFHLGIKPFACTWPDCPFSAATKSDVVRHIRTKHFKLPVTKKNQALLNIEDNRNPEDYVQVDNQLLEGRLE